MYRNMIYLRTVEKTTCLLAQGPMSERVITITIIVIQPLAVSRERLATKWHRHCSVPQSTMLINSFIMPLDCALPSFLLLHTRPQSKVSHVSFILQSFNLADTTCDPNQTRSRAKTPHEPDLPNAGEARVKLKSDPIQLEITEGHKASAHQTYHSKREAKSAKGSGADPAKH
jgi:hypothetical protein